MKDGDLSIEEITKKYDFRENVIERTQNLGIIAGYGCSLISVIFDILTENSSNIKDLFGVCGGYIVGTGSYSLGNYLHKRNEEKREEDIKKIKNIEKRTIEEEVK